MRTFAALFFMTWLNLAINQEIELKNGSEAFRLWEKPPVVPVISIYVYNVTNADAFLNNGSKPIVDEIGPYVYTETWERKNIVFNENGTISYNLQKIYVFDKSSSAGTEDDVVVVPNIPMLSITSNLKNTHLLYKLSIQFALESSNAKPFVEVSIGQLLWGYEDPLLKLTKSILPEEQRPLYEEYGLMYNKNGTSEDNVTIFTGASDITKRGLIETYNGMSHLTHWLGEHCNSLLASDGSIFPPHISKNSTLYIYDKDFCRTVPLKFEKEFQREDGVLSYRFTPPNDVFGSVTENPDNLCFCPHGPPCSPSGLFNVSLCRFGSPVMISFPHFYLSNENYTNVIEGISRTDPEKHKLYFDIHPMTGTVLSAKIRVQINLAVSHVNDIKRVANVPDILFPIMWFEESLSGVSLKK